MKINLFGKRAPLSIALLFSAFSVYAQLLNENFNFTGDLSANSWSIISAGGTNPISAATNSGLSYAGFTNSNNGNAATMTSTGEDLKKNLSTTWDSTVTPALYATFMLKITTLPSTTGDYLCGFTSGGLGTNYDLRFYAKGNGGNIDFGIARRNGTPVFSGNTYALNQTYLVTVKYAFLSGPSSANDVCSFYIHPLSTLTETEPTMTANYNTSGTGTGNDASEINAFFLRQGTNTNNVNAVIDGIRVATDWATSLGSVVNTCRYQDSLQLVTLYNSTAGADWTNKWDLLQPMTSWYGVTLNASGCVTCIDLDGVVDCTQPQVLEANGNKLIGTIPNLKLPNLTHLFLSNNKLSGSIPLFDSLYILEYLTLCSTELSGPIPKFSQTSLQQIRIYGNPMVNGAIPNFNLPNLQVLFLFSNNHDGSIPAF